MGNVVCIQIRAPADETLQQVGLHYRNRSKGSSERYASLWQRPRKDARPSRKWEACSR